MSHTISYWTIIQTLICVQLRSILISYSDKEETSFGTINSDLPNQLIETLWIEWHKKCEYGKCMITSNAKINVRKKIQKTLILYLLRQTSETSQKNALFSDFRAHCASIQKKKTGCLRPFDTWIMTLFPPKTTTWSSIFRFP